jgi:hypothetical protein
MLNPLPEAMAKLYIDNVAHMSKASHMYNCMFSIGKHLFFFFVLVVPSWSVLLLPAGTGVDNGKTDENGKKGGYEKFNGMEAALSRLLLLLLLQLLPPLRLKEKKPRSRKLLLQLFPPKQPRVTLLRALLTEHL